jgi:protein ImuB
VPNFALTALYRAEPALREIPLALTDGTGPRAMIAAVSDTAAQHGVRAGLTAAQGTAICASLGRAAQAALCEVVESCSPRVEDASDTDEGSYGIIYLDARGAPFPSEHALGAALTACAARVGLEVRVGIASTKVTARLAAHQSSGVTVVPRDAERRFLAPLPITLLEPAPELTATLARWGVTRLGELACLSPAAMGTRLGPAGATLVRCARGEDDTPLVPRPARLHFEEEGQLDYGIDTLEPLVFVLRGCIDRLAARLALRGLACSDLRLSLGLATRACEERTVAVAAPTTDAKTLLILTRLHLEAAPPAAPVETLRVAAVPVRVRTAQLDLFRPAGPAPEHLATTVARLTAICGPGRVGAPVVVNSHRSEILALAPFDPSGGPVIRSLGNPASESAGPYPPSGQTSAAVSPAHHRRPCHLALRALRPPRPVEVFDNQGRPDFVRGDGLGGRVVALAGPWRLAGEWWTEKRFARDYYDMGLSDGGVYRIYRDLRTAQWFVEGAYD